MIETYYEAHKEARKEYRKKHYETNKDKIKEYLSKAEVKMARAAYMREYRKKKKSLD